MEKQCDTNDKLFSIRVKHGQSEIEVKIPLTPRSLIGLGRDENQTGTAALKIVDALVEKVVKLAGEYPSKSKQPQKKN